MRRLLSAALLTLVLAGCGSPTVQLTLTYDTNDAEKQSELLQAATRVIGRRLSRWEGVMPEQITAKQESGSTLLTFDVNDTEARTTLMEEMLKPFSLTVMTLSTEEKGDLYVEEQGWFNETGITQQHIGWVEAGTDQKGKGSVRLNFTQDGLKLLNTILQANPKAVVGLFVRGRLMSKMQMEGVDLRQDILIQNIPTFELASIFADDVNVGTHVIFSQPHS